MFLKPKKRPCLKLNDLSDEQARGLVLDIFKAKPLIAKELIESVLSNTLPSEDSIKEMRSYIG